MSAKKRSSILSVEQLEERNNPGILVPTAGTPNNILGVAGPGLQNNGVYMVAPGAYGAAFPNNGPAIGTKENFLSQNLTFGAAGYIDSVFQINNSQVGNGGDVSKLSYSQKLWMTADSGGVFGNFDSIDKLHPLKNLWQKESAV